MTVAAFPSRVAHLVSRDVITVVVTRGVVPRHAVRGAPRVRAVVVEVAVHFHTHCHSVECTQREVDLNQLHAN